MAIGEPPATWSTCGSPFITEDVAIITRGVINLTRHALKLRLCGKRRRIFTGNCRRLASFHFLLRFSIWVAVGATLSDKLDVEGVRGS